MAAASVNGIDALAEFIRISKYARWIPSLHRRETWPEQVQRVMLCNAQDMHREFYKDKADELEPLLTRIQDAILNRRILGSQRGLQFGGPAILRKHARLYNCTATYCDRVRAFQETMWLLLCGCGVGVSVQKHHIAKLPAIRPVNKGEVAVFSVPDSIEGWADALGVLLSAYFVSDQTFPAFSNKTVEFDYSGIRPKGAAIAHMDGKAPGFEPLQKSLENIRRVLERAAQLGDRLRPIDAFDIITHSSDAVIAGGVRRSALLTLFSLDDADMMAAKTGSWFIENPQRGRSNNSVLLLRNEVTLEQFRRIISSTKQFGEPGFIWADDTEVLTNPCAEIHLRGYAESSTLYAQSSTLYAVSSTLCLKQRSFRYDIDGNSGSQFCNLCEINMKVVKSPQEFYEACELASALGTLQAGYTDFPYLGKVTESIVRAEALIGVSMTGMCDNPAIAFNPHFQRHGASVVVETNRLVASLLGINPAARCTTVKPAGTTSCLLGTASGIHPHHAKRYFRRVQANHLEVPLQHYKKVNPASVEASHWSSNGTDDVVTFLCEIPENALTKSDVGAIDLLTKVQLTQRNWIAHGSPHPSRKHNVSNTVTVKADEWDKVADFIYEGRNDFVGVSLLGETGDLDYAQAPFQAVYTPAELARLYGDASMFASGLIVHAQKAFAGNLSRACDTFLGIGEKLNELPKLNEFMPESIDKLQQDLSTLSEKILWMKRAEKFTDRYFLGDKRQMTYCLRCVNALKDWCDIQRSLVRVDWDKLLEDTDTTSPSTDAACAGGACVLVRL